MNEIDFSEKMLWEKILKIAFRSFYILKFSDALLEESFDPRQAIQLWNGGEKKAKRKLPWNYDSDKDKGKVNCDIGVVLFCSFVF